MGALLEALRPAQWVKNGFVFAALIFSRNLLTADRTLRVAYAAGLFCLMASALYLLNDVMDAAEDRQHPTKRLRPIASNRVSAQTALRVAAFLALTALAAAWVLDVQFLIWPDGVWQHQCALFIVLKHIMLLDVFVIAAGFVCRVVAGGVVIHVEISPWLIVCTTLLALFLALTKRRHELVLLGPECFEPPLQPGALQPLFSRPTDRNRHRFHPHVLCALYAFE